MKKYLVYDEINNDYKRFETIEQAREYLEESLLKDDFYGPYTRECMIYKLKEIVDYEIIDKKSNYKYVHEEDIPEGDDSEAWPYCDEYDQVCKHKFVPVR